MDKRVSLGERVSQCAEVHRTPFQYTRSANGILILGSTEGIFEGDIRTGLWGEEGRAKPEERRQSKGVFKVQEGPKEDEEEER